MVLEWEKFQIQNRMDSKKLGLGKVLDLGARDF